MKNSHKLRLSSAVLALLLGTTLLAGCESDAVGASSSANASNTT